MKTNIVFLETMLLIATSFWFGSCSDPVENPSDDAMLRTRATGQLAVGFALPDFADSYVYLVKEGNATIAEICKEYIHATGEQVVTVYPYANGKADQANGMVAETGAFYYVVNGAVVEGASAATVVPSVPDLLGDRENNVYKIVKIGTQYWTAENWKCTTGPAGEAIDVAYGFDFVEKMDIPCYTIYTPLADADPASIPDNVKTPELAVANYGLLYNYWAAMNLAPEGWKLPANADWEALRGYLGESGRTQADEALAGNLLRENSLAHWDTLIVADGNITGFTAVGSGSIEFGFCNSIQFTGKWWSATEDPNEYGELYAYYWTVESRSAIFSGGTMTTIYEPGDPGVKAEHTNAGTSGYAVRFVRN